MLISSKHKYCYLLLLTIIATLSLGCKSTESASTKEADAAAFDKLVNLLKSQSYHIDIEAAQPFNTAATTEVLNTIMIPRTGNSANRIDLQGDGHYIKSEEGNFKASLPYFGEQRQAGGHYSPKGNNLSFNDTLEDHEMTIDEKKQKAVVTFTIDDDKDRSENYDVRITAFPNGYADIYITSTHRTNIRYMGKLKPIKEATRH